MFQVLFNYLDFRFQTRVRNLLTMISLALVCLSSGGYKIIQDSVETRMYTIWVAMPWCLRKVSSWGPLCDHLREFTFAQKVQVLER